jgi:CHASE3 domain sensor protein
MRELAVELGQQMPEYEALANAQIKRRAALINKYGKSDPAVAAFGETSYAELQQKALELGKTTPEYKATLKEQIEVVKEALAGGKQELKSKRGTQTTRKVSLAKKEEATGSPESRAAGAERNRRKALSTQEQERLTKEVNESDAAGREEERFARGVEVESPDLTPTQVASLQDNDLEAVLQDMANDKGTSALNRAVALRLALLLDITNVEIVPGLKDKDGREVLGMATSRMVSLNANGGVSQEVLLHEGTHAGTERVIQLYERDPSQLTEMQRVAVRELKALHAAAKADPRITSVNAKSSLSEFVAEVMSNRNLQEQLRKKAWKL